MTVTEEHVPVAENSNAIALGLLGDEWKGRAFFPHVMVMLDWGDKWFRASEGPATMLTHTSCGGQFRPVLHCSVCGLELHGSQIQVGSDPPKAAEPKAVPSVRLAGGLDGFGGGLDELRHLVGVRDHRYVTGLDFDGGCAHAPSELGQRRRARRSPSSFLSCSNSQP
jgi:hypothetical protein